MTYYYDHQQEMEEEIERVSGETISERLRVHLDAEYARIAKVEAREAKSLEWFKTTNGDVAP